LSRVDHALHLQGVGRGEHIGGGTFAQLQNQSRRSSAMQLYARVWVGTLEGLAQLFEYVGKRGSGEDGDAVRMVLPASVREQQE
jgi:hypothetical protein